MRGCLEKRRMKRIPLTQGKVALIDDEDYAIVNLFKWFAHKRRYTFYATTTITIGSKRTTLLMHRLIMSLKSNEQGDHKDHNGLNNQKSNLRLCTHSQNQWNQQTRTNTTSKYKGIFWKKSCNKWCAQIHFNDKVFHLGVFKNEKKAAKAYDEKALELFGEFACLNLKEVKQ